jgi:glycosyltransferase involved in cell wall biosynthesis
MSTPIFTPPASAEGEDHPQLACIILSVDAPNHLKDAVESILSQGVACEIVVVNSGERAPYELLEPYGEAIRILHHGGRLLPGAARNLGIAASRAPLVAFLAADCIARPGWISRRLAAHREAAAVSSAVCNATPGNLAALASYLLLFSRRMPRTRDRDWLHYGVSYSRELFGRYGCFDEGLRGGEDTEFHRRFADQTEIRRGCGIETAHRHPETMRTLLEDQYRRGGRAYRAFQAIGDGATAAGLPYRAVLRSGCSFWRFWSASGSVDRLRALAALPVVAAGAWVYAAGALRARFEPATAEPPGPAPESVHVLLQVRNGMRFLPGYLENLRGKVAGIIALDDGSTDGSRELLEGDPLVRGLTCHSPRDDHAWNETENRATLLNAARNLGATWVIALDVDERLPENVSERLAMTLRRAEAEGLGAFYLWLRELWNQPDQYRVDGIWGSKRVARLFDLRRGSRPDERALHGHWAPVDAAVGGAFPQAELEIFHLNMISPEAREERRRKYEGLDPDNRWQAIGYRYLTDATGLVCRRVPEAAMYRPRASGSEIDPRPPGLIALLAFHNEAAYLPGYLDNVGPHVDGIIALDDGSTDESPDLVRSHPKLLELLVNPARTPHVWNEPDNQRRLIEAAGRHGADWLLVVDADERLERDFRQRANAAIWAAQRQGIRALGIRIRELWGSTESYRCDGLWGEKRKASLFQYRPDHEFDPRPLHNYWAPLNSRVDGRYPPADLELYHLRMVQPEDRRQRLERYRRLDPGNRWQPQGYEYLIDDRGIQLARPAPGRHFLTADDTDLPEHPSGLREEAQE